ncbi:MAG: enoyl-CoA hydratase-related protein [Christensenella sp.]|uniref:enoyl-CoA hydratase-related protein n=1 Tax=Christensenella sp. TaxID=1935934 RepID=UPI002B221893|nr:enoyl-CoA hydratase-related protein [Christensenella sp.]MEA5002500.1 enoyl-CoA hydratase-related protein [Christensenella sp.]
MTKDVKFEVEGAVGILTITREGALNALNSAVLTALERIIEGIDLDTIRCLVLTGAGKKAFVAGADIAEMAQKDYPEGKAFAEKGNAVFRKLEELPIPVIAAVNGFALGGGCELSMCCDIRLASENALFGQPETGLGIIPGFGGTQRLMRRIPVGKAKEMIFACTNIKAAEALSLGLVNGVYPQEELMPAAMKLAGKIANNAPVAVRRAKAAMNQGIEVDIDSGISLECEAFGRCFETEDQSEGMAAFLEKRKHAPFKNN